MSALEHILLNDNSVVKRVQLGKMAVRLDINVVSRYYARR